MACFYFVAFVYGNFRDLALDRRGQFKGCLVGFEFNQRLVGSRNVTPLESGGVCFSAHLQDAGSALITAMKPAKAAADHVVLRVAETAGRNVSGARLHIKGARAVWLANIVEDPVGPVALHDGAVTFSLRPWEVRTYLVQAGCPHE